ncbi:MAG: zf-HC2 domain-containing protein [Gemmatimonadaceae bacterium]
MADNELTTPSHVDEGTMHAWLDGALSLDEARTVESHVANCAQCSAAAAEARGLIAASTRILSALDDVSANIIPVAKDSSRAAALAPRRRWNARMYGPIAAVALFAVGATLFLRRTPTLVPTSAQRQKVATVSVAPPVAKENLPVATAPQSPVAAPRSEPVAHAAPTPLAAAAIEERRAAVATTTASDAVTQKSSASGLGFDATKPAAAATAFRARLADGAVATNSVSSQGGDSVTRLLGDVRTDGVQVKGPPTMAGARVVSTNEYNSGDAHLRRTVFALDSGATVTLLERRTLTAVQARTAVNAETTAPVVPLALRAPSLLGVQSVMWIASDGSMLTLSGPLSVSELEALKARIVP